MLPAPGRGARAAHRGHGVFDLRSAQLTADSSRSPLKTTNEPLSLASSTQPEIKSLSSLCSSSRSSRRPPSSWRPPGSEFAYCSWNLKGIVYSVATGLPSKRTGVICQVASALSIASSSIGIDLMIWQPVRAPVVVMTHLAISVP